MQEKHKPKNILKYYIGGRIKKVFLKVYDSFFPKLTIDWDLLHNNIKEYGLKQTTKELKQEYERLPFAKNDNTEYFDHMLHWVQSEKHITENPFFLYPPNIAVIDFLLKNTNKDTQILDYGCGLAHLLIYLRRLGFNNTFGYDDFSQIAPKTIHSFLEKFNSSDIVLSKNQVLSFKPRVVSCICYFWKNLDKDFIEKEVHDPVVEYILLDHYYAPRHIKNFKIAGIYKNLLIVFKRVHY